jgi:hypothetical protein
MARLLNLQRFHLRLVVFCITVLLSVGVAFPGQCWVSRSDRIISHSRSFAVRLNLSSTTPKKRVNDKQDVFPRRESEPISVRGGGEDSIATEKEIIQIYLESLDSTSTTLDKFHIHGWRWHTRSLIREVGRLHRLALKTSLDNVGQLQEASDYVVDFNLRGLHKIEADLFFPWMRQQLTSLPKDRDVCKAFASVMTELEKDRVKVSQLGKKIQQNAASAGDSRKPSQFRSEAIQKIADQAEELQHCARSMMELEDNYLVPAIAALVPEKEQKSFNNKVLRGLGLLDSRLHLVGMYEAVASDTNRREEEELFQKAIPSVPQMMIPRWKRKLYAPKTYMLE